jgi:predicted dehydrogenase
MPRRFAVLGLGSIGLRHANNLLALGQQVCGFDPSPARRAMLDGVVAERESALEGVDAVVIASPSGAHLDDLRRALASGLHVFVEKPLAHRIDGLQELLADAAAAGRVVFAGLMLRYHPCVERAKQALQAGRIGVPIWARSICASYLPGWRPDQDYRQGYAADPAGGGVILDVVHELDLLVHLLGPAEIVASVAGRSGRLEMPTEDMADIVLTHAGGARSNAHLDYLTRPPQRITEIAGDEGFIRIDLNARRFVEYGANGVLRADEALPGTYADDYRKEMQDFIAAIEGTSRPRCDGMEALAVLRLALAARRKAGLA